MTDLQQIIMEGDEDAIKLIYSSMSVREFADLFAETMIRCNMWIPFARHNYILVAASFSLFVEITSAVTTVAIKHKSVILGVALQKLGYLYKGRKTIPGFANKHHSYERRN